jgi:IS30 family transposase
VWGDPAGATSSTRGPVVAGGTRRDLTRSSGWSLRLIAAELGRAPSTISREVAANGGPRRYRAVHADRAAWVRATRPKQCKLAAHPALRDIVEAKLVTRWSPQQIAGWLAVTYPDQPELRVSHETIYRTLLPDGRGSRPNTINISQRPAEVADRAVPGHWEGDLVFGKGMSPVATLVERSTRFVILVALPGGDHRAEPVADALATAIAKLPAQLAKSLTWDLGHEMAQHQRFSEKTGMSVYFCDPKSPWQRGSNENTNGLLRQYLPRRLNFRTLTQTDFDTIAAELNDRPRQTLGFKTPSQALAEVLR